MGQEKLNFSDQIMNYAKGHYPGTDDVFADISKIYKACGKEPNTTIMLEEISMLVWLDLLEADDPMKDFTEFILFMFRTIDENIERQHMFELDPLDMQKRKVKKAIVETALRALLVVMAKYIPDNVEDIQQPTSKVMTVTPPVYKKKKGS